MYYTRRQLHQSCQTAWKEDIARKAHLPPTPLKKKTMSSTHHFARPVLYICTSGLILVVAALGTVQILKFSEGHTTYSEKKERHLRLRYPHVTFCPGFKDRAESALWTRDNLASTFADDDAGPDGGDVGGIRSGNFSEEELRALWTATTFDLGEVLPLVLIATATEGGRRGRGGGEQKEQRYDVRRDGVPPDCLDVRGHDALLGRCYTLSFPCSDLSGPARRVDSVDLLFNVSAIPKGRLSLYFHDELDDLYLGVNENYWALPVTWKSLHRDEVMELGLRKRVRKNDGGVSTREHFRCLRELLRKDLDPELTSGGDVCLFPTFANFLGFLYHNASVVGHCDSYQKMLRARSTMFDLLLVLFYRYQDFCRAPSEEVTYEVSTRDTPVLRTAGLSQVYVFFTSTDVMVTVEYALLDLGTLLSTLGGVIGMFLGWSALDLVRTCCSALGKLSVVR